jgi:primosomal protein N'
MHVATIIPIARGIPFDTLTYYTSEALSPGTLVLAPFGKQLIIGIVITTTPLAEAKSLIKQAAFSLKKIKQVLGHIPYFAQAIGALETAALETFAPVGAVAGSVIPQFLFEYMQGEKLSSILEPLERPIPLTPEQVITAPVAERTDQYKRLIRSAFAEKQSVYFVAPTIRALTLWKSRLEKGIQKHVIVLHSKITKKQLRSAFSLIKTSERPLLVFVTPGFFLVPRKDMGHVIAENESSSLYKTHDRYSIDTRIVIQTFCELAHIPLTWGDVMPRFETLERLGAAHLPRAYVPEKLHIVPIDHYRTTLPSEVMDLIRHAEKKKYRIFIYTNRKGIAPLSRCADCGTLVVCPTCSLPMVLRTRIRGGERERFFVCTHCADELDTNHICTHCGSWNISPMPIGTESVSEAVASLVGTESVYTIDDELTPDAVAVEKILTEIQQKKFAVIVGTTKVLSYLRGIHYTLIPYFDRILSTPSLYTVEHALRLVMECNEQSSNGVIVCTRSPDFLFTKQLETQKINTIISDELSLRKEIGYPPYGTLVKISLTVPEGHRQKTKEYVESYLKEVDITALPPRRISPGSMKVLLVWIIKTTHSYIEEESMSLTSFFDSLRFPYKIEQNPERF